MRERVCYAGLVLGRSVWGGRRVDGLFRRELASSLVDDKLPQCHTYIIFAGGSLSPDGARGKGYCCCWAGCKEDGALRDVRDTRCPWISRLPTVWKIRALAAMMW